MSASQAWNNILIYALQIGLLVVLGALAPVLLRLKMPRSRLLCWQVVLAGCLALPWVRPWRQEVVTAASQVSSVFTAVATSAPVRRGIPWTEIALFVLMAGVLIRLAWLGAGLTRLAAYRRRARSLPSELAMPVGGVELLLSDDVSSPVTFGWRDPVVLLPVSFPALSDTTRQAILCHELEHVARRDWLFTIAEELVRSVLWFHPAVWWVIGEIQLAREQTVDQAVIEMTNARGSYVDALLLMAGASGQMDLAPAAMFLRRRHLKRRIVEVMKEVRMSAISKTRLVFLQTAAVLMVAAACWLAAGTFRLSATPQVVADSPGVEVNMNGSQLMHRGPVAYPVEALAKGVEGTVALQVKLDADGDVLDAMILSGPDELRKGALMSVLGWHFDKSAALATRVVNIDFVKPSGAAAQALPAASPSGPAVMPRMAGPPPPPPPPPPPTSGKLDRIVVAGLSDAARSELLARLPIREGGEWSPTMFADVRKAVQAFDSHLVTGLARSASGELSLRIGVPNVATAATPGGMTINNIITPVGSGFGAGYGAGSGGGMEAPPTPPLPPGVYRVGSGVMPPAVVEHADPIYTEEARAAKYSGEVVLSLVINTAGKAEDIKVIKPLGMGLDERAIEAVQQWVFRPGTKDGVPVKVMANVAVNFRLL